jgi:hypothetical protein
MATQQLKNTMKLPSKTLSVQSLDSDSPKIQEATASMAPPKARRAEVDGPPKHKGKGQGTPRKVKQSVANNAMQEPLFDEHGLAPFSFVNDALPVDGQPGWFKVAEMSVQLKPIPRDPKRALEMTLEALRAFYFSRSVWDAPASGGIEGGIEPNQFGSGMCKNCTASFRPQIDNGIIQATYSRPDNLALSLPHPSIWQATGLHWLEAGHDCCPDNFENRTPWLGHTCGCP